MDLAAFGVANIEVFLLTLIRTAGIFTLVPIFGGTQIPAQVKVMLAAALAMIFVPLNAPASHAPIANDIFTMLMLVAKEAVVGITIGFATSLVFSAMQIAGDFIDMQAGFSFAQMYDPVNGGQAALAGRFHHILAGLLFFITNAHHSLISALAQSFSIIPVGQMSLNPMVANGVLDMFISLFLIALRIAAPVIGAVFLADVAMAIVSRAVPQMNIMMVGMPVKLGIGMLGMVIALPVTSALCQGSLGSIHSYTTALVRLLAVH